MNAIADQFHAGKSAMVDHSSGFFALHTLSLVRKAVTRFSSRRR
jgi:hypothetical protein